MCELSYYLRNNIVTQLFSLLSPPTLSLVLLLTGVFQFLQVPLTFNLKMTQLFISVELMIVLLYKLSTASFFISSPIRSNLYVLFQPGCSTPSLVALGFGLVMFCGSET